MIVQIAIGTVLMPTTIAVAGASLWWVEVQLRRRHDWLTQAPHAPKLLALLCGAAVWVLGIVTFGVWLWALTLCGLGLFDGVEPAVYFALVSFTTLGYGDLLLPEAGGFSAAWRRRTVSSPSASSLPAFPKPCAPSGSPRSPAMMPGVRSPVRSSCGPKRPRSATSRPPPRRRQA